MNRIFRFLNRRPEPSRQERVASAVRRLRAKHSREVCGSDCPTLVLLEELERLRGIVGEDR